MTTVRAEDGYAVSETLAFSLEVLFPSTESNHRTPQVLKVLSFSLEVSRSLKTLLSHKGCFLLSDACFLCLPILTLSVSQTLGLTYICVPSQRLSSTSHAYFTSL